MGSYTFLDCDLQQVKKEKMMLASEVKTAFDYLDQLKRIDDLISNSPPNVDSVSITFKNSAGQSKTVSFKNDPIFVHLRDEMGDMKLILEQKLMAMGVDVNG